MDTVTVNGVEIAKAAIAAEMQHHPASSREASYRSASQALAVRTLLLSRAKALQIQPAPQNDENAKREIDEEALIRQLIELEVKTPEPDEASCARYYENNRNRFKSNGIFEASHILFGVTRTDLQAYEQVAKQAATIIDALKSRPGLFEDFARRYSTCPSAAHGGNLGQITRGETTPEFETILFSLEEGQLCSVPVKTRYGIHVLKLHRRIEGKLLPFEGVKDRIAAFLSEAVWRKAVAQYIGLLVGEADIRGLGLQAASTPLVQ